MTSLGISTLGISTIDSSLWISSSNQACFVLEVGFLGLELKLLEL
jgi:hypothetical protein